MTEAEFKTRMALEGQTAAYPSLDTDEVDLILLASRRRDAENNAPDDYRPWVAGSPCATLGQYRVPTVRNGWVYQVTTAGSCGAVEPTWPTTAIGDTVTDGTVVWTLVADAS